MKEIGSEDFMTIDGGMSLALSVINGTSCVLGSLGNMALIAVILLHKQLHGASEILLMSLALADFVSCAVYLPLLLVRLNTKEKLPTIMNQSRRAIGQAAVVCVSLNLLMLTADRLIFFYRPLRYCHWMRKRVVIGTIIIIYGISFTVGIYAYYDMIKSQYPKVALVGVPMLIFFLLHYAICRLASAHRTQVANQELSLQHNYHVTTSAMVQAKRNVRTVMLFGILYLVTWLPVTIFQLRRSVTDYHDPKSFQKYFYLLLTLQQISASIDPYLCYYRNNKVKAVFKKLLPSRNTNKVGGHSLGNTMSLSCSDLDSNSRKHSANFPGSEKPASTVRESIENIYSTTRALEQSVGNASKDTVEPNLGKTSPDVSTIEPPVITLSERTENIYLTTRAFIEPAGNTDDVDKIADVSTVERSVLTVSFQNISNDEGIGGSLETLEDIDRESLNNVQDSNITENLNYSISTEQSALTERLQKTCDAKDLRKTTNSEKDIESSTSINKVVSNLIKEFNLEQSDQLINEIRTSEQSLGATDSHLISGEDMKSSKPAQPALLNLSESVNDYEGTCITKL